MRSGYWVVAIFATAWGVAGLLADGLPAWCALIPIAISAALLGWAYATPSTAKASPPHVGKLIARWSIFEGVAIPVACSVLRHLHHDDALFSAVAVIVGIHFIPLARGIPVRIYHATGAGLIALGVLGLLLPAAERPLAIGLGAAAILWATAAYRLLESRRPALA